MLPFMVLRTQNRTSRAILRDGTVEIRLARGLGMLEEHRHIENLLRRVTKAAARHASRALINPFRPILEGLSTEETLTTVTGASFTVKVQPQDGKRLKAMRTESGWNVLRNPDSDPVRFHRFLWKLATMILAEEAARYVRDINAATFRESVKGVRLRFARSRWGSCSHRGDIMLSTPLFFTSEEILRYVTVHELAHIVHPDHSKRFWNAVERHDPSYLSSLKKLKGMRLPPI